VLPPLEFELSVKPFLRWAEY